MTVAAPAPPSNGRPLPPFDAIPTAWAGLSPEQQAEIGRLAITMVFGAFVGGDGYDDADRYSTEHIRGEAEDQGNKAVADIHTRIMTMLPDLFGSDHVDESGNGEDPPWAWRDPDEFEIAISRIEASVARRRGRIDRLRQHVDALRAGA